MLTNSQTTHVRAYKPTARRLSKMAKKMKEDHPRERWTVPDVLDEALNALESKLAEAAKAHA